MELVSSVRSRLYRDENQTDNAPLSSYINRRYPGVMRTSSSRLGKVTCLITVVALVNSICSQATEQCDRASETLVRSGGDLIDQNEAARSTPEDYPYQPDVSRVRRLIEVFESLSSRSYTRKEKHEKIVSLSEAASKLIVMSNGLPLKTKCNKYVKLISKPNVLTYSVVDSLMEDDSHPSETEQSDAQTLPRLMNERRFDALGKLQTIIQSLESERLNEHSDYKPNVKRDLLECMNYYIYRHQRATFGLTRLVRDSLDELTPKVQSDETELTLRKYHKLMSELEHIEAKDEGEAPNSEWLNKLSKLNDLARQNNYELPRLVRDFMTEPKRLDRLHFYDQLQIEAKSLAARLVEIELGQSDLELIGSIEYMRALVNLNEMVESHKDSMPKELADFLLEPARWRLIKTRSKLATGLGKGSDSDCGVKYENGLDMYDGHAILRASDANYCRKLSEKLNCTLRTFNVHLMNSDQAIKLARSISGYKIECIIRGSDLSSQNGSQWPVLSLIKKLSSWCSSRLKEPPSSQTDENSTAIVLEMLRDIRGED